MIGFKLNKSAFMEPLHLPPSAWIGHIPFAGWVVEEIKPRVFVELGSHHGTSYLGFCQAIKENGIESKCFAVDTWQGDEHAGSYDDSVFEALDSYHGDRYSGFSQLLRMTFDDALPNFADGSVDLLHIDGLHTYEAVRHDFETWLPKLSSRGVVLFHDTMVRDRGFGVWKFWAEVRGRYPSFEFLHSHGLGVLLVGAELPDSVRFLAQVEGTPDGAQVLRLFNSLASLIAYRTRTLGLQGMVADRDELLRRAHEQDISRQRELAALAASLSDERTQASSHAQHLAMEISEQGRCLAEVTATLDETRHKIAERDISIATLASEIEAREERLRDLGGEVTELRSSVENNRQSSERLGRDLEVMLRSRSWRVTAPLRKMLASFRKRDQ